MLAGIERASNELHRVQIGLSEHLRHLVGLVRADAMLSSDRATNIETERQDLRRDLLRQRCLSRDTVVIAHERMEVAVAGMKTRCQS